MAKYTLTLITNDITDEVANELLNLVCNIALEMKLKMSSLNFVSDKPIEEPEEI